MKKVKFLTSFKQVHVGDVLQIREDLSTCNDIFDSGLTPLMRQRAGELVKVSRIVSGHSCMIERDRNHFWWDAEMFYLNINDDTLWT